MNSTVLYRSSCNCCCHCCWCSKQKLVLQSFGRKVIFGTERKQPSACTVISYVKIKIKNKYGNHLVYTSCCQLCRKPTGFLFFSFFLPFFLILFFFFLFYFIFVFLKVFPDLRAWCENRRLHLVDCDLRWVSSPYHYASGAESGFYQMYQNISNSCLTWCQFVLKPRLSNGSCCERFLTLCGFFLGCAKRLDYRTDSSHMFRRD